MAGSKIVFREYTSDDSFTKLIDIPQDVSEIQVALTFARDYDGKRSTQGDFIPHWDTAKVNPEVIAEFKSKCPSAKVLVSIGNDNGHFPFKIDENKVHEWIDAATKSLTRIIDDYKLDGIDVHYENIDVKWAIFDNCIGALIKALKLEKKDIIVSISPNMETNDTFYLSLHQNYKDHIDNINLFLSVDHLTGKTNQEELLKKLKSTLSQYPGPNNCLLGYSSIPSLPPIFFVVCKILQSNSVINGMSLKATSYSITNFPRQCILELLQSPFSILGLCKL